MVNVHIRKRWELGIFANSLTFQFVFGVGGIAPHIPELGGHIVDRRLAPNVLTKPAMPRVRAHLGMMIPIY